MGMQTGSDRDSLAAEYIVVGVGVLLVCLGTAYQAAASAAKSTGLLNDIVAGILLAVGGGVLGAGLQNLMVRRYEFNVLSAVNDVLAASISAQFTSVDRDLRPYRHRWHHYYLTEARGEWVWWYESCDFDRSVNVSSLGHRTTLRDSDGQLHSYLTEVGVRGQRLVLLESREDGVEAAGIEIFPMPRAFRSVHTGVACLETWDGLQVITKSILSKDQLIKDVPEGRITPDQSDLLDEEWNSNFLRHCKVLLGERPEAP